MGLSHQDPKSPDTVNMKERKNMYISTKPQLGPRGYLVPTTTCDKEIILSEYFPFFFYSLLLGDALFTNLTSK